MIEFWNRMDWASPWAFSLLLLLPYLWYFLIRKSKNSEDRFLFPSTSGWKSFSDFKVLVYKFIPYLKLGAFVLLVLALARPRWMLREEKINAEGIDIFLVMDLSSSMLSRDFEPNRLEVSKKVAIEFIKARQYDRIGIVVFSGEGYTQCPLTNDHKVLINLLEQLQFGFLEDGTAIGTGLMLALNRLKEVSSPSKVIILLTDGVNNAGEIRPELAAQIAKELNVKIYSIGIGTMGQAYSPVGRDANGDYIFGMTQVNIDEALLTKISAETGGRYFRATNLEKLKAVYSEIDKLEKTKMDVRIIKRYSEQFRYFLSLGFILLLLEYLLKKIFIPILSVYV